MASKWVKEENKREIENTLKQVKREHDIPTLMGCNESSCKRKPYSCEYIPQEKKISS